MQLDKDYLSHSKCDVDIQADQNNENCVSDNAHLDRTFIEVIQNDSDLLHDFNILHASDVSANSSMRSPL